MSTYLIVILSVFVALAATAGAGVFVIRGYNDDIHKAEGELRNLALALVERTDKSLHAVDAVAKEIIERFSKKDVRTAEEFQKIAGTHEMFGILREKAMNLPHVGAISLIDSNGLVIGTSRQWPYPGRASARDRTYFQALSTDVSQTAYLSEPLMSRMSGERAIVFARKMVGINGEFLGIVQSDINIEFFEGLYKSHQPTPTADITLFRRDGSVLARYPDTPKAPVRVEAVHSASVARLLTENNEIFLRDVSPLDKQERLVAARILSDYPVGITVSERVSTILSAWKINSLAVGLIALMMDAAIGIACFLGFKQVRTSILRVASESYLARHDILTKIPNRPFFLEEMKRAISSAAKSGSDFAVHVVDLDRFKGINDTLGHPAGDLLIQKVARRLSGCLRKTDFLARIGGDEFAIIQKPIRDVSDAVALAERIKSALAPAHDIFGKPITSKCSIGIALGPAHGKTADELLKAADLALHAAKGEPETTYRFYDAERNRKRLAQGELEIALQGALENEEFELVFQPIQSVSSAELWGCEALIRWRHPTKGMISPGDFIPTAEATGLITPLGEWVLREACLAAEQWPKPMKIAVNVSPIQFKAGNLLENVKGALSASRLPPERLTLEITESVQLDDAATTVLRQLKAMGVSIALDDFGTGFASMSYLRSFPFDKIKIDRSFVKDIGNPDSRAIIRATIALARDLKMETTAEGVETEEQLDELRRAGASQVQGYLLSRPLDASQLRAFMAQWDQAPAFLRSAS